MKKNNQNGITMLELLIVLAIIGILSSVVLLGFQRTLNHNKATAFLKESLNVIAFLSTKDYQSDTSITPPFGFKSSNLEGTKYFVIGDINVLVKKNNTGFEFSAKQSSPDLCSSLQTMISYPLTAVEFDEENKVCTLNFSIFTDKKDTTD